MHVLKVRRKAEKQKQGKSMVTFLSSPKRGTFGQHSSLLQQTLPLNHPQNIREILFYYPSSLKEKTIIKAPNSLPPDPFLLYQAESIPPTL
jgi:hypothetical protein